MYVRRTDSPLAEKLVNGHDTGRLPEEIHFVKFSSITWTPDSKGFFYQVRFYHYLLDGYPFMLSGVTALPRQSQPHRRKCHNRNSRGRGCYGLLSPHWHTAMCLCSISSQARGLFFFPAEDILIHEDKKNPTWMFSIDFTEKKEYITFYTMKDTSRVSKAG